MTDLSTHPQFAEYFRKAEIGLYHPVLKELDDFAVRDITIAALCLMQGAGIVKFENKGELRFAAEVTVRSLQAKRPVTA